MEQEIVRKTDDPNVTYHKRGVSHWVQVHQSRTYMDEYSWNRAVTAYGVTDEVPQGAGIASTTYSNKPTGNVPYGFEQWEDDESDVVPEEDYDRTDWALTILFWGVILATIYFTVTYLVGG